MYLADMSEYQTRTRHDRFTWLAIGWLDEAYPFPTGSTPVEFQERLLEHCVRGVHALMTGYHTCQFCESETINEERTPKITRIYYKGKSYPTGNGEIWIPDGNIVYRAPVMIYHYVTIHYYQPPEAFINAVLHCPPPYEDEYQAFVRSLNDKTYDFTSDQTDRTDTPVSCE